jgi:hypothetical protein
VRVTVKPPVEVREQIVAHGRTPVASSMVRASEERMLDG